MFSQNAPKEQYALVLKSVISALEDSNVLYHICEKGVYCPAFPLPENFSIDHIHRILGNAPKVLFRGLSLDQAREIQNRFFHPNELLICFDPTGDAPIPRLMDQVYKPSNKQGLSFWTTVGAVILGVICALLLLSIL